MITRSRHTIPIYLFTDDNNYNTIEVTLSEMMFMSSWGGCRWHPEACENLKLPVLSLTLSVWHAHQFIGDFFLKFLCDVFHLVVHDFSHCHNFIPGATIIVQGKGEVGPFLWDPWHRGQKWSSTMGWPRMMFFLDHIRSLIGVPSHHHLICR